jgi:membrane associated rhomboid family serine protease
VPSVSSRFSLSFPGRRGQDDPWFRIGAVDVNTSLLLALLCGISLFVWAASPSALLHVALLPDEVTSGQIWRILTWPLYNKPDIWTVLNIAMLWYFGKELERMVGRAKFAVLLSLLAVVPGIVAVLLNVGIGGIRPVEIAVFCLFVAEYPHVRFFFGVPAWVLAAVIVGIEVLQYLGPRNYELIVLLAVSLGTAALAGRSFGLLAEYPFIPRLAGGASRGGSSRGGASRGGRPSSAAGHNRRPKVTGSRGRDFDRVVAGPWTGPSPDDHAEMDRLLDKMNSVGLSDAERRRLTELGRKLRGG